MAPFSDPSPGGLVETDGIPLLPVSGGPAEAGPVSGGGEEDYCLSRAVGPPR